MYVVVYMYTTGVNYVFVNITMLLYVYALVYLHARIYKYLYSL